MYIFHASNNKTLLFERRDTVQRKETSWNLCLYLKVSSSSLGPPPQYLSRLLQYFQRFVRYLQEKSSTKQANLRFLQHAILLFKLRNTNALVY